MRDYSPENFIMFPVPASQFAAVCALIGGASIGALASGGSGGGTAPVSQVSIADLAPQPEPVEQPSGDVEIDAHGHPWSADLHASTKGKTKDGLWRLKVGATRPDPLPGFPKGEAPTGTSNGGADSGQPSSASTAPAPSPDSSDDDDEFAAFRAANSASEAASAASAAPAREYTDADLSALCNQAATKLGDPAPVKAIIAPFVPEGQVPHSRNIPAERRAEFVKAVEDKAGIKFAG